jgi:hypothetical protein
MIRLLLALALVAGVSSAAQAQGLPTQATVTLPTVTTGTSLVAKSTAGNLYGYSFTEGATAGYFAILDASAAPSVGAAITPLECVPVAANAYVRARQTVADRFNNGLVVVSTSSCTTFTAVTPALMEALVQ